MGNISVLKVTTVARTTTLDQTVNSVIVLILTIVSTMNTSQARTASVESGTDVATLFATIQSYTTVTERLVELS